MPATTTKPISFKRPLVGLWTVLSVTDLKSEDDVLAAIEDGSLLWAFDLKTKRAKARLVRVLAASVCDFVAGNPPPKMTEADEWRQVQNLIFGAPASSIPAKEIALAWNISGTHMLNLCDEKLLRLAKGSPRHCGPGGSPLVIFQSAVEFLRERRIF
jgi:hypothetical protein